MALQEPEIQVSTFNASLEVVDSPDAVFSSQSTYTRRQVSIEKQAYDMALCKGRQLLSNVDQNIDYRISGVNSYQELATNGWSHQQVNQEPPEDLAPALSNLGISTSK